MNFFHDLKKLFALPKILVVAKKELAHAELDLLKAETGVEYAMSLVMFNKSRIRRLKTFLIEQNDTSL